MKIMIDEAEVICPYCGEVFTLQVDCSAGDQDYIEDCPVCCRPIEYQASCSEGLLLDLTSRREDE